MPRGTDGSIIGDSTAVSISSASGIWTMNEVDKYNTEGIWPLQKQYVAATGPDNGSGLLAGVEIGDYKYHTFLATKVSGSDGFNVSNRGNANGSNTLEYFIIAGGGSGRTASTTSGWGRGGGGGGGYRTATNMVCPAIGNHNVTVGSGGTSSLASGGTSGGDSVFNGITTDGGGKGGGDANAGTTGGSGGGGGGSGTAALNGGDGFNTANGDAYNQGNDGGDTNDTRSSGGGGGGAGQGGFPGTVSGVYGLGGIGGYGVNEMWGLSDSATNTILTTLSLGHDTGGFRWFGGGGGGCGNAVVAGGSGGGGASTNTYSASTATAGTANTGGGGGGGSYGGYGAGADGGSGIVILRYKFQN